MTDHLNSTIVSMPLAELRERVELAERLAIANRFASTAIPAGAGASAASASGDGKVAQPGAGVKQQTAAEKKAAAAAAEAAKKTAATPPADDDDAAFGDGTSSGAGDFGEGDDMLDGFVEDLSPEQAKAAAIEIAKKVIAKKDAKELASARTIMQSYSVSKVSDIPDDNAVEAYNKFKEAFPHYAAS
jgi:hypothetical protein